MRAEDLHPVDFFFELEGSNFVLQAPYLIIDKNTAGRLIQNLVQVLNPRRVAQFLVRVGFASGYSFALNIRDAINWDSPEEWLRAGFILPEKMGLYKIKSLHIESIDNPPNFYFRFVVSHSGEAEVQRIFVGNLLENFSGCWFTSGYLSGYTSAYFKRKIIAQEKECVLRGAQNCVFVGMPKTKWSEDELFMAMRIYTGLSFEEELDLLYEELKRLNAELRRKNVELEKLSHTDELTRVYNRRYVFKFLKEYLNEGGGALSAAVLDLDGFKELNDSFGHKIGDQVLIEFANLLKDEVDDRGIVARWGGDEFIILLKENAETAYQIAERIREKVESYKFAPPVGRGKVTVSFGITEYVPGESIDNFITRADSALYEAKRQGKNRVILSLAPGF